MQDENGAITKNFFNKNLDLKKSYKFLSGPFLNKIFKILSIEKNSLRIKIEGLNTFIKKEKNTYLILSKNTNDCKSFYRLFAKCGAMENPLVTIYITNRNYGAYLEKAIHSTLNQTYKNIEIIIVDDSSNDNSQKILKDLKNITK